MGFHVPLSHVIRELLHTEYMDSCEILHLQIEIISPESGHKINHEQKTLIT